MGWACFLGVVLMFLVGLFLVVVCAKEACSWVATNRQMAIVMAIGCLVIALALYLLIQIVIAPG